MPKYLLENIFEKLANLGRHQNLFKTVSFSMRFSYRKVTDPANIIQYFPYFKDETIKITGLMVLL